jgi:hypothetical protein
VTDDKYRGFDTPKPLELLGRMNTRLLEAAIHLVADVGQIAQGLHGHHFLIVNRDYVDVTLRHKSSMWCFSGCSSGLPT